MLRWREGAVMIVCVAYKLIVLPTEAEIVSLSGPAKALLPLLNLRVKSPNDRQIILFVAGRSIFNFNSILNPPEPKNPQKVESLKP